MARRWALLASETWDAERRAGEEEAAAEVVSLVDRLRKDVHEVQVALSQAQSTSTSTRREYETLRRVMSAAGAPPEATAAELRQMDTEYHKQRNALVVTQDAVWSAQQQAAYREVQVVSMRREGAKIAWQLEEACGNLPRLEDLCEKEAWEQRCMERERQAAVVAEEQTAAGRRQLQEEVQMGRQRLDELRKSLEWTQEQTAEEEAQRLAELRALKREQRREEDELAASSALVARQEQVADENRQLRQCWQEELQEVSVLEESTAGLRKDAAAERVRGKTWQDKLRRSVEEAKELRRSLQESESQCQVHRQALQKARQRPSELAGIKAAFVSASASTWRESMSDFGSLVKSPASASSADRRQRLSAELRAAETLYANTKLQVSEMRSQIRMLQLEQGASRASGPRALPAANSDVSAGLLRRRQAQAERRASLRLRSVAEALGRQSQDASRSLASETLAISESSEEAPEEDVVEELHSLTVPSNMPGASKDDRQVPPPPASISACSSLPEYLRQRAEATRRAILRGEIHAAEMALELRPSAQIP
ncbi:unnamed protein product [Symbiodinium sp. CCMP2456]|nr:unnamed protein product [Symbiodinium sp. CCMP2456]